MKLNFGKWLDVTIETINLIIIYYALANMEFLFQISFASALFSASQAWIAYKYWETMSRHLNNKVIPVILIVLCIVVVGLLLSTVGYVVGELVPLPFR